jgi:hypothetical protein
MFVMVYVYQVLIAPMSRHHGLKARVLQKAAGGRFFLGIWCGKRGPSRAV